ncbi:MAG: hypothetical protein ACLRFI_02165 [Alphaproteobacteria bacterium]
MTEVKKEKIEVNVKRKRVQDDKARKNALRDMRKVKIFIKGQSDLSRER